MIKKLKKGDICKLNFILTTNYNSLTKPHLIKIFRDGFLTYKSQSEYMFSSKHVVALLGVRVVP